HGVAYDEAVDDDVDVVLDLLLQHGRLGQGVDDAVDADPGEAGGLQLTEEVGVLALAAADDGREHLEAGALGHRPQPVDDLLRGLRGNPLPADRAELGTGAGVQQPQVVVDLGDGADGGSRVAARGLLVDGDGRAQALDEVDVGLVHLPEELARVGRQRLDVAALPLGEDGVEGEGRLPGARQAGEDDEAVTRQVEVDVAEVVLTRTPHEKLITHPAMIRAPPQPVHVFEVTGVAGAVGTTGTAPWRYAIGMFGTSIPITMVKGSMILFYVDILGLDVRAYGVVMAVYAVVDALDNPLLGHLSDRTRTRYGRRRPWLLVGAPLLALGLVGFFWVPDTVDGVALVLWFAVFAVLCEAADSLLNANYGALLPELFPTERRRARANSLRQGFQLVALVVSLALTPLLTTRLLGTEDSVVGFRTAVLYAVVATVAIVVMALGAQENPAYARAPRSRFPPTVLTILRSPLFWRSGWPAPATSARWRWCSAGSSSTCATPSACRWPTPSTSRVPSSSSLPARSPGGPGWWPSGARPGHGGSGSRCSPWVSCRSSSPTGSRRRSPPACSSPSAGRGCWPPTTSSSRGCSTMTPPRTGSTGRGSSSRPSGCSAGSTGCSAGR